MATLVLRHDQLDKFRAFAIRQGRVELKSDAGLAKAMEIHPAQLSRVLRGGAPGMRFVAGLAKVFGIEFLQELFIMEPDDSGAAA